jgi:hypothetical protein
MRKPPLDDIAWSGFAAGVALMLGVTLLAAVSESDGDYRTWETIRLHRDLLLEAGLLAVSLPVVVVLLRTGPEPARWLRRRPAMTFGILGGVGGSILRLRWGAPAASLFALFSTLVLLIVLASAVAGRPGIQRVPEKESVDPDL